MRWTLCFAGAIAVMTLGANSPAEAQIARCASDWGGELRLAGASWRIGIEREPDGELVVDVPLMWRAGEHATDVNFGRREIQFNLPYDLGRFSGRLSDCNLVGEVVRQDGARATVAWAAAARTPITRENLTIESDGVIVAATLVRPSTTTAVPAVIVLHGGGDSSRADSPPYVFWGDYLARRGFAVLLYDKRGNGDSTGNWRTVGFDDRARDVAALAEALAARRGIQGNRIGLFAVSQGGWVAVRAAQLSNRIAFAAMVSAPVVTPLAADTYASWTGARRAGLTAEEADERILLWSAYVEFVRSGGRDEEWNTLMRRVRDAEARPWFARRPFDPEPRVDPFVSWYPLVLDYDPAPALEATNIPMLWVYGAADTQSDVGRNVAILTSLRDRRGKPYEIAVLAGGDHGLGQPAPTLSGNSTYFTAAPGFMETIDAWFDARAR